MKFNKKAISPVIATALLLVVAVVAVVGFQSWFTTYQSGVNVKVEQESNAGSALVVERLEINGTVYVKNSATENVLVLTTSKIVDSTGTAVPGCDGAGDMTAGINATASQVTAINLGVPATGCTADLTPGAKYDVVVVTTGGVFSSTQLAR